MDLLLTDSHCHLTATAFAGELGSVVARARDAGVTRMICIASDPDDAEEARRVAQGHAGVWSTAGVHPHQAGEAGDGALDRIRELALTAECVAVGETGLDYHYDHSPRPVQLVSFEAHLALAAELGLPVVVHSREAEEDMAAVLRERGAGVTGVLHCFGGPWQMAELALDLGWYLSFTGISTFKRFDHELLRSVPENRYMVETDAPYLAPVPHRGKRNEPAFLPLIVAAIADARGEETERVAQQTWRNAATFYGLPADEAS